MNGTTPTLIVIIVGLLTACGGRTALELGADAGVDASPSCDSCPDDGIACTVERCNAEGECVSVPDESLCEGCGVFSCDLALGCVQESPECDDSISCTMDSCDGERCVYVPDSSLCEGDDACHAGFGCTERVYACSGRTMLEVELPSGTARPLRELPLECLALAITSDDGRIYVGHEEGIRDVGTLWGEPDDRHFARSHREVAGICAGSGQHLWAPIHGRLARLDLPPGGYVPVRQGTHDGPYHGPIRALEFVGIRIYATRERADGGPDHTSSLFLLDHLGGRVIYLGSTGFECVEALAEAGGRLYGFTCNREIIELDLDTGAGRLVGMTEVALDGATRSW